MNTDRKAIGAWVKQSRVSLRMTQVEFARQLGMLQGTLSRIERGLLDLLYFHGRIILGLLKNPALVRRPRRRIDSGIDREG